MRVLGIETSCDETALAVLDFDRQGGVTIRAEQIASQVKLHEAYGGVVPELAAREHLAALPLLLERTLSESGLALGDIDIVGVTIGPGLKGCLLMGINFAMGLADGAGRELRGVHHIEGHLLAPMLDNPDLKPPFLSLIVSGGHTELVHVEAVGRYAVLARTSDDAAGEAFDKSAALLGLPYPGGPRLAKLADSGSDLGYELPKVMREAQGFSFSGLKTAVRNLVLRNQDALHDEARRAGLAFAIQEAIVDALVFKVESALARSDCKELCVTGGVAANRRLRERLSKLPGVRLWAPTFTHCVDNAAMIAFAAGVRERLGERFRLPLATRSRWPLEEIGA